jgi:sulfatase maturation enzyme AslB (radical SAM superfamily)
MLLQPKVHEYDDWVFLHRDAGKVLYNRNSQLLMSIDAAAGIDELTDFIPKLCDGSSRKQSGTRGRALSRAFLPIMGGEPSRLGRLTINIANACNLWCSYCYADHGQYHAASSLMAPATAVHIVERCLKFYPTIRSLQFFGGEPLLNVAAIEAVGEYLTTRYGKNGPTLVATTNGTVLSERTVDVLAKYGIALTVSLDGPAEIHDHLRPAKSLRSSHAAAMANIDILRSRGIELDIECTYTSGHLRNEISVVDLMNYFYDELGIDVPHIAWAYLPRPTEGIRGSELQNNVFRTELNTQMREHLPAETLEWEFREAAALSIRNIVNASGPALSFVMGIAKQLATRTPTCNYCPAFNTQLSISAQGEAFPCFMFYGDPRMNMGNIFSADFPGIRVQEVWNRYATEFGALPTGEDEWFSGLVSGCVAGDYIATSSFSDRPYRRVNRAMIEEVLLGLGATANSLPA